MKYSPRTEWVAIYWPGMLVTVLFVVTAWTSSAFENVNENFCVSGYNISV